MPKTSLLLREVLSSSSLTSIVAKSQLLRPPFSEYSLNINSSQLDITLLTTAVTKYIKPIQHDEGFESDVDSISLLSSDDSFTSSTCLVEDHVLKHRESDSANGSSSSESDTEISGATVGNIDVGINRTDGKIQSFPLSEVLCYTDVNYPKVLLFVIKNEVFVFSFDNLEVLQSFYTSFNTLKAVTNQRTYGRNFNTTFNLLQRTDNNGITHIEISREPATKLTLPEPFETSSIISINTPDTKLVEAVVQPVAQPRVRPVITNPRTNKFLDDSKLLLQSELRSSRSEFYPQTSINSFTLRPKSALIDKPLTNPQLLNNSQNYPSDNQQQEVSFRKVWKSAEDLLDSPKRPERRRKIKGRAPPPPVDQNQQNIMKGQFIRVAVDPKKSGDVKSSQNDSKPNFQTFSSNVQTFTPNWNNLATPKSPLILTTVGNNPRQTFKQMPTVKLQEYKLKNEQNWTNSVPRLLRKPRSKSETRQATPMAYRYIDTTSKPQNSQHISSTQTISNRLFGLSQKLKEFGTNVVSTNNRNFSFYDGTTEPRRNSLGEMTYKSSSTESNLKSVIKKQVDRKNKSGEKKVTFSAYATVQVV